MAMTLFLKHSAIDKGSIRKVNMGRPTSKLENNQNNNSKIFNLKQACKP
jgi:hypothetical protein